MVVPVGSSRTMVNAKARYGPPGTSRQYSAKASSPFKAVGTIESDFERRRVLTSILKRGDNPDDVQARLLQAASTIQSDFELATFLVSFAKVYPEMSPAMRETFMKAADSIDSEHEYGRVMQSVRGTARRTNGMF